MRWGELVPVGGWGQKLSGLTYIDVRATFDKIDTDGSGTLDRHEVERAAQELGHGIRWAGARRGNGEDGRERRR